APPAFFALLDFLAPPDFFAPPDRFLDDPDPLLDDIPLLLDLRFEGDYPTKRAKTGAWRFQFRTRTTMPRWRATS
ncbi:MAG TPA: hypothetical protein VIM22_02100, partial [Solirubrobacteraceae bacterium]